MRYDFSSLSTILKIDKLGKQIPNQYQRESDIPSFVVMLDLYVKPSIYLDQEGTIEVSCEEPENKKMKCSPYSTQMEEIQDMPVDTSEVTLPDLPKISLVPVDAKDLK